MKSLAQRRAKLQQRKPKMETPTEIKTQATPEVKPATPRQEERKAARKERIPLGNARLRLTAPQRPGKVQRWVNDVGGRIEQAQVGGYEFVHDEGQPIGDPGTDGNQDIGSRISRIVGTSMDGKPQRAFLMEIDKELYDADQLKKSKRLDEVDSEIRRGTFKVTPNDNRYVPKEGITYKP